MIENIINRKINSLHFQYNFIGLLVKKKHQECAIRTIDFGRKFIKALWGYHTCRLFHSKSPTWSPIWASWVGDQIDLKSARVIAQIGVFLPQPGGCRSDQKLAGNV